MMSTVGQGGTRAYLQVPAGDICLSIQDAKNHANSSSYKVNRKKDVEYFV